MKCRKPLFVILVVFLLVLPFSLGLTTINLTSSEIILDTATKFNTPSTPLDTTVDWPFCDIAGCETRAYGQINITKIPSDFTVFNATLYVYTIQRGATMTAQFFNVYANSSDRLTSGITWGNDKVCSSTVGLIINGSACNITDRQDISVSVNNTRLPVNVTGFLKHHLTAESNNLTFMFTTPTSGAGNTNWFATSEHATENFIWYITVIGQAVSVDLEEFTITADDTYDDVSLNNISVRIFNSSFSINTTTENGTIVINNGTIPSFDSLYTINFGSNDTGGYFNRSFGGINITDSGSFKGSLFQSVLKVMAIDGLTNTTIADFTATTNLSSDTSVNSQVLILIKNGTFQLNISATGFSDVSTIFVIDALQNNSLNISMGSIFTFRLVRESTNTVFDFNSTNGTTLNIFCPNQTIQIFFNTSSNFTQIINCDFTLMQIVVDYGVLGSYFRTQITPFSQKNVTLYLIDLIAGDTAIQKIIKLLDLTGDFDNAILSVDRSIGGVTRTVIDQRFDISNQVNLFLLKDALYNIRINNGLEEIILGNLIPTEAGEQTITLPKIKFVPTETTLGDDISWAYTFNITSNILRLQYVDTTNLTTLVRFTVFNDTPIGLQQLFLGESQNNSTVTITFNQAFANTTYVTELFIKHPDLGNFTDKKIFYQFKSSGAIDLEGWTPAEQVNIKKWVAWIFLGVWGLLFSRRYTGIGMTSMIIMLWLFRKWAWIDVSGLIFGFVALLAVVGWLVDAMRRN